MWSPMVCPLWVTHYEVKFTHSLSGSKLFRHFTHQAPEPGLELGTITSAFQCLHHYTTIPRHTANNFVCMVDIVCLQINISTNTVCEQYISSISFLSKMIKLYLCGMWNDKRSKHSSSMSVIPNLISRSGLKNELLIFLAFTIFFIVQTLSCPTNNATLAKITFQRPILLLCINSHPCVIFSTSIWSSVNFTFAKSGESIFCHMLLSTINQKRLSGYLFLQRLDWPHLVHFAWVIKDNI